MTLATRCPHCRTAFRVANDQLKLRGGLVRCGQCKEIFNGIENLLPAEAPQRPAAPAATTPMPPIPPAIPLPVSQSDAPAAQAHPESPAKEESEPKPEPKPAPAHSSSVDGAHPVAETGAAPETAIDAGPSPAVDPLLRMTLMDFAAHDDETEPPPRQDGAPANDGSPTGRRAGDLSSAAPDQPDPIDAAIAAIASSPARKTERAPWRMRVGRRNDDGENEDGEENAEDAEEPGFLVEGRRKSRRGTTRSVWLVVASILLALALLAQIGYAMRSTILSRFPQSGPILASACRVLGCALSLPTEADALLIESSDLQSTAAGSDILSLSFLLRNRSGSTQAWPSIELTMNDAADKPLARKVFAPHDYLHSAEAVAAGIPADHEQPAKILFQFTGPKASGYRIYLFYP